MIVSISGPMHVGKTTLAKGLVRKYESVIRTPMAQALRELCEQYGIPETRDNMQKVGHGLREADPDVWVKAWYRRNGLKIDNTLLIDDARYQNEVDMGYLHINLWTAQQQQWQRYQTSDKFDPSLHQSDWAAYTQHTTEVQTLATPDNTTLRLDTTHMTPEETLDIVSDYLSPRLELREREAVQELPW
jgi:hypothetical protein